MLIRSSSDPWLLNMILSITKSNMVNKMTTSRLELRFKRAQEPLVIETRSSNKKQANANCAVLAVRELYKRGFIEKFGTRTENYDDEQVLSPNNNLAVAFMKSIRPLS